MKRIWKKRLYLAVFSAVTTVLLLAVSEVIARSVLDDREFSRSDFYGVVGADKASMILQTDWGRGFVEGFSELMEAHPTRVWRVRPDLNIEASGISMDLFGVGVRAKWLIQTDSRGYRLTSAHASPVHVVGVGDSSTFGWGLDKPFLTRLNARTTNLGVPGYSSAQGLLLANEVLANLKPDFVTLAFGANDAHRVYTPDELTLRARTTPIGRLRYVISQQRIAKFVRDFLGPKQKGEVMERVSPDGFRKNLKSLVTSVRALDAQPVLLSWCANRDWDEVMKELSVELNVPLIREQDIREYIRSERSENRIPATIRDEFSANYDSSVLAAHPKLYETNDGCHPSVWAHQILADRLQALVD